MSLISSRRFRISVPLHTTSASPSAAASSRRGAGDGSGQPAALQRKRGEEVAAKATAAVAAKEAKAREAERIAAKKKLDDERQEIRERIAKEDSYQKSMQRQAADTRLAQLLADMTEDNPSEEGGSLPHVTHTYDLDFDVDDGEPLLPELFIPFNDALDVVTFLSTRRNADALVEYLKRCMAYDPDTFHREIINQLFTPEYRSSLYWPRSDGR